MLKSLGNISNPFVRSLTAAFTVGSVITIAAAIAIEVTHPKNDSAYKSALITAFVGAGGGALFGLGYRNKDGKNITSSAQASPFLSASADGIWKDWRDFVVVRKVKESEEITSFYLQPEDRGEIPNFQPGQFLTIKLDIPGQPRPIIRTYSLSDYAESCDYYRLSIKREPSPKGLDVPPGIASNFMHDQIHVGSVIQAKPPSGRFVLDVQRSLPAVLISNGVGITPMISMAKAVTHLNRDRPIWFLHGARDGRFHAFREEMQTIAQQNPNLTLHFAYSRPRPEDAGNFHSAGYIDPGLIQSLVNQEAEYFLCGSPPFMESIRQGLSNAGIPDNRVLFEMFTPAKKASQEKPEADLVQKDGAEKTIVFQSSAQSNIWDSDSASILEFAEENGLNPPYSCRQGICGTCQCKLLAGEVAYQETPTAEVEAGSVLICISKPKTSTLVLDL